jgi:hypothetical protein
MRILSLGVAMLLAVSACVKSDAAAVAATSTTAPADHRARTAALTANAMAANPAAADSILRASGYTKDGFEKLMYEIAADSAKSAEYAAARSR